MIVIVMVVVVVSMLAINPILLMPLPLDTHRQLARPLIPLNISPAINPLPAATLGANLSQTHFVISKHPLRSPPPSKHRYAGHQRSCLTSKMNTSASTTGKHARGAICLDEGSGGWGELPEVRWGNVRYERVLLNV